LEKEAAFYEEEDLERTLHVLAQTVDRLRRSESPRASFELACLDLSRKTLSVDALLERLEELEQRLADNAPAPGPAPSFVKKKPELTEAAPPVPAPAPVPTPAPAAAAPTMPSVSFPERTAPPARTAAPAAAVDAASLRRAWPQVLETVARKKPALESILAAARPELSSEGSLRLLCANDFQRAQIAGSLALLTEIVLKEVGPVPVSCALAPATAAAAPPAPLPGAPAPFPARAMPPAPRPAPVEDAEEVSDDGGEAPPEEEDAAPAPAAKATAADEWTSSTASAPDAAEIAAMDPGLKKVLDRFPGKLKKLETA
jgi:DNA polymerase-3 subunit gamma/tau